MKSSAESLNPRPRVSDLRPDICIWDIRQDIVISHGTKALLLKVYHKSFIKALQKHYKKVACFHVLKKTCSSFKDTLIGCFIYFQNVIEWILPKLVMS